ncbi:MAG: penicillin-binding protein, partial [Deltaproteobacteria bacterium]|nr:penicillin-binding protein [Deltaproteobacteria bacterium]
MRTPPPASFLKARIFLVTGLILLLFGAIFYRAFKLQVLDANSLQKMASSQHTKTVSVQAKRGDIYDRNSRELAVSIEVDSVYAQPVKVESARLYARALAPVLAMERSEIEKRLNSERGFVWLKRQIDLKEEERGTVAELE